MPPFSAFLILGPANANLSFLFGVRLRAVDLKSARQREEGILQMMAKSDKKREEKAFACVAPKGLLFFWLWLWSFKVAAWLPFSPQMEKQKISHQRARRGVSNGIHCECRFN